MLHLDVDLADQGHALGLSRQPLYSRGTELHRLALVRASRLREAKCVSICCRPLSLDFSTLRGHGGRCCDHVDSVGDSFCRR